MKNWKIKLVFLLLFSIFFSEIAFAHRGNIGIDNGKNISQDIKIYYVKDLKAIGYDISGDRYNNLSSNQKDKITTKLQAYLYKEAIGPIREIKNAITTDKLFSPEEMGYYLLVLDKKVFEGKVLVSKPILIYYSGNNQMINVKSEKLDRDDLKELEVILNWVGGPLSDRVRIGLYDEDGRLIEEIWLRGENNWRHIFSKLNPLKNYSIWIENIDGILFTINRVGNTIYIENIIKKTPEKRPGDILPPEIDDPDIIITEEEITEPTDDKDIDIEIEPDKDKSMDEDKGKEADTIKADDTKRKLPQTGLLWWPVPVLFAIGLFFYIISFKEDKDE